jgi:hypothetical protein
MRCHLIATTVALALAPCICFAQGSVEAGAAGGAAAGGAVAGPVGAVVGGTVGATVGLVAPPPEVRSYVVEEDVPSVTVERQIIVGEPLPPTVVLHTIPRHTRYRFAVVNHRRVIVDPGTRRVIQIVD